MVKSMPKIKSIYDQIEELYREGKYFESLELTTKYITSHKNDARLYANRGRCHYYLKKYDLALSDLNTSIKLRGKQLDTWSHYYRAVTYRALNRLAEAEVDIALAVKLYPDHKSPSFQTMCSTQHGIQSLLALEKVKTLYNQGKYQESVTLATESINKKMTEPLFYFFRGCCYYYLKNYTTALSDLNVSVQKAPDHAWSYYYRSAVYKNLGDFIKAQQDSHKAASLYPANGESLAMITTLKKNIDELVETENDRNDIIKYVKAVVLGMHQGVLDVLNLISHPIDELVLPVSRLIYNSQIINSVTTNKYSILALAADPSANDALVMQHIIAVNPNIFYATQDEINSYVAEVMDAVNSIISATNAERVQLITRMLTAAYIPSGIMSCIKIHHNLAKFQTITKPPKFADWMKDVGMPSQPLPILTHAKIRNFVGERELMYVLTEELELIISETTYPKSLKSEGLGVAQVKHSQLGHLKPVLAAGELKTNNGQIININNHSGHYLPQGKQLDKLVTDAFTKFGFSEAVGKYKSTINTVKARNAIIIKESIAPAPSTAVILSSLASLPAKVTASPTPAKVTASPTPAKVTATPTPAKVTATPTPAKVTATPTPAKVTATPAKKTAPTTKKATVPAKKTAPTTKKATVPAKKTAPTTKKATAPAMKTAPNAFFEEQRRKQQDEQRKKEIQRREAYRAAERERTYKKLDDDYRARSAEHKKNMARLEKIQEEQRKMFRDMAQKRLERMAASGYYNYSSTNIYSNIGRGSSSTASSSSTSSTGYGSRSTAPSHLDCTYYSSPTSVIGQYSPAGSLQRGVTQGLFCRPIGSNTAQIRYETERQWQSDYKKFHP
jgi:tetratricopeptide (TPR) repeat protein